MDFEYGFYELDGDQIQKLLAFLSDKELPEEMVRLVNDITYSLEQQTREEYEMAVMDSYNFWG